MNLPSIPDNLYKFLVLIGIVLIGYFYFYKLEPLQKNKEISKKIFLNKMDSLDVNANSFEKDARHLTDSIKKIYSEIDNLIKLIPNKDHCIT